MVDSMVLGDLLARKQFQYLKVLNANADLSRTVFTVESTETTDVAKYIPQNTLLLMTGMAFKDNPLHMCSFLEELDEISCAGVAIKLGRFIDKLDERVIAAADQLGLAILQIPMNVTLGQVYREILSYIWENQNDYLLGALNAQKKISNLILQGSSMKSIVNNMTMILNKPVMIMDLFGTILEYGYNYTRADREKTVEDVELLMKGKRLEEEKYSVYQKEGRRFCIHPVKGVSRNTNYIVISDFDPKEKEETVLILEQIIMALEMYFYRSLYVKYNDMEIWEEYRSFFFSQLEKTPESEPQVLTMGKSYGLKKASKYRIVILAMGIEDARKFNPVNFSKNEERFILIYHWMVRMLSDREDVIIFPQKSKWRYICLLHEDMVDDLSIFTQIYEMVREKFDLEITAAQGGVVSAFANITKSLHDAEQCMIDGNRNETYPYILSYKPKNMLELFKFIPEREIRDICEHTLKELAYPRDEMEEELRKTLYTYLSCNGSITKTAETLYLHRNTVKYRLKKCKEILNNDFSDVSSCFQLQLALILTEQAQ